MKNRLRQGLKTRQRRVMKRIDQANANSQSPMLAMRAVQYELAGESYEIRESRAAYLKQCRGSMIITPEALAHRTTGIELPYKPSSSMFRDLQRPTANTRIVAI